MLNWRQPNATTVWVTWAAGCCCLNFKCSQLDSPFPFCNGGGEGFQRPIISSTLHLQRELHQNICWLWKSLQEKRHFLTNSSWLPLTLIYVRLAPLCLAAAAAALSRDSATGSPALNISCWAPKRAMSCPLQYYIAPALSVGISPGAVLEEAWGFGLERHFYMTFSIII